VKIWSEILRGRDHLGDLGVDGGNISMNLLKSLGGCGLDSRGL
jgi:hypothetical protein